MVGVCGHAVLDASVMDRDVQVLHGVARVERSLKYPVERDEAAAVHALAQAVQVLELPSQLRLDRRVGRA